MLVSWDIEFLMVEVVQLRRVPQTQQAFETTTLELSVVSCSCFLIVLQEHCCVFAWFVGVLVCLICYTIIPAFLGFPLPHKGLCKRCFYLLVQYLTPAFTARLIWNTVCLAGIHSLLHHVIMDWVRILLLVLGRTTMQVFLELDYFSTQSFNHSFQQVDFTFLAIVQTGRTKKGVITCRQ